VLREDAEVVDGRLDDDEYRALFSIDPVTGEVSTRDRETAYPYCYSWNPPGGGGYCFKQEAQP
jgi:hypothetical protein